MTSLSVASRSFSKHPILREKVLSLYPDAKFNDEGLSLYGDSLVNFLKGSEMAITALEEINEDVLKQLPELRVIGKYGVGLDMIDLNALSEYGVSLGWKGGVNKRSVSELVISSAIALLHKSTIANNRVKKGSWNQIRGRQLTGKTVGIIGCGNIGKDLISLLKPYKCKILSNDILDFPDFYKANDIVACELNDLLSLSDVVTLHLPLNESTYQIINTERLNLMKQDSVLINYARGGLIDESALDELIKVNKFSGVALDVFEHEPPVDTYLSNYENVFVTPHIGGSTEEAVLSMGLSAIEGLQSPSDPSKFIGK
ncbi:phosphoglycerate dehydrogenase [Gammaproteobacteria bacterium]|nr:phosphoglycerate dehydrogenase [Gammaproteobacteria bacterium]